MAIRIHELHPTIVHYPLALVPLAVLADLAGKLLGSRGLMNLGSKLMPVAAASAAAAGAAGLVAQGAVHPEGEAHDMLTTHRNLNIGLVAVVGALAVSRARKVEPSFLEIAIGLVGLGAMTYTAYLGGKMVYKHGVGVQAAGGVREDAAPELRPGTISPALAQAGRNAADAARHTVHHLREGEIAPTLRSPRGNGASPAH